MVYTCQYQSPMGDILLAADEIGLDDCGLLGRNTLPTYFRMNMALKYKFLQGTKRWLDVYFSGEEPNFTPPLHPIGSAFRQEVWQILLQIPYGQTTTYGEDCQTNS